MRTDVACPPRSTDDDRPHEARERRGAALQGLRRARSRTSTSSGVRGLPSWNFTFGSQLELPRRGVDRAPARSRGRGSVVRCDRSDVSGSKMCNDERYVGARIVPVRVDRRDIGRQADRRANRPTSSPRSAAPRRRRAATPYRRKTERTTIGHGVMRQLRDEDNTLASIGLTNRRSSPITAIRRGKIRRDASRAHVQREQRSSSDENRRGDEEDLLKRGVGFGRCGARHRGQVSRECAAGVRRRTR